MVKLLCLLTWVAFHFDQVHSCWLSKANIERVYVQGGDVLLIQLGWPGKNPRPCKVSLNEEHPPKIEFETVDTQICDDWYCYFNTSKISCVNGVPQLPDMKFSANCDKCHVSFFIFDLSDLQKKIKGNAVELCPREQNPYIPLNITTPDCVKPGEEVVIKFWEVNARRKYTYTIRSSGGDVKRRETLPGQTDLNKGFSVEGIIGTLRINTQGWHPGNYSFEVEDISSDDSEKNVETGDFSIKAGCKTIRDLNINVNPYCDKGIQNTEITWDVVSDRRYQYKIINTSNNNVVKQGEGAGTGDGNFTVSGGRTEVKVTLVAGNYRVTVKDLDAGVQEFYRESKDFSIEECKQRHPLNLTVPSCVRSSESSIQISWTVMSDRLYSYTIMIGNLNFAKNVSGAQSSENFVVSGGRGTLTITTQGEWPIGMSIVTIEDLSSSIPSNETASFIIKKGCKPIQPLDIDASGICVGVESTGRISWRVQANRTYKYTVRRGGKVVQAATVPGSGSASFPVSNGRGQVSLILEPGDYTVTVQDLDAGVKRFYSESKDFSVADCKLEIRTNTCVESGQNVELTLDATEGHYSYTILVEGKTSQVVKSGPVGASQGGNRYVLASTNTLPVGRYILMITEEKTGGEGYDRFQVTASGDIGSEVRYTAEGVPSGMYICLDPIQGGSFAGGLTAKVGSAAEASLTGQGKCYLEPYTGSESTLTISVRKNGGTADQVAIRYLG